MKTFAQTITELPIKSPAPWSFCRDPETGECVLLEECTSGFQVRPNPFMGFDDSAVDFIQWPEARLLAMDHNGIVPESTTRIRISTGFAILSKQVTQ